MKNVKIQTSPFAELVAVSATLATNPTYDIIIDDEINLKTYCTSLLSKIFELPQSQFHLFINYQCTKVKDAITWLNKFEKLLATNENIFSTKQQLSRYNKLFFLIETKRKELQSTSVKYTMAKPQMKYINAESEDRYFSFYELKKQIGNLKTENEKILLLTQELYEYEQSNIDFINVKTPIYSEQCKKEIEHILGLKKLRDELQVNIINANNSQIPFTKLKINCNLNQIVDVFYQLNRELFDNGKPLIDGAVNDFIAVICNSYVDKDGRDISPDTVRTILTPSRQEKRPKTNNRIDIDTLLKKI